ncbi:MAG TPA: DUF2231 domain-containing protein [Myxococcota bacterium]
MLPDPLHPAVVHFPIALAVLTPLFAALILFAIRTHRTPALTWAVVVLLQALLVGSAWLAHETGEDQEERVEKVLEESYIEEHEAAADWVLWIGAAGLAATLLGLAGGSAGAWARAGALAISLLTLAAAVRTGHLGGELVYRHGAANAYLEKPEAAPAPEPYAH